MENKKNAVELLLSLNANELDTPKKIHKMYCKKLKQEIEFEIEAINPEKALKMQRQAVSFTNDGRVEIGDMYAIKVKTIAEGCKMFKNPDLVAHYGCANPYQLIGKLFVAGEIDELANAITSLSEVEKIEADEIKN